MKVKVEKHRYEDVLTYFEFMYDNDWYVSENKHAYHLMYGVLNHYPLCCILYFCSIQDNYDMNTRPKLNNCIAPVSCPECAWNYFSLGLLKYLFD